MTAPATHEAPTTFERLRVLLDPLTPARRPGEWVSDSIVFTLSVAVWATYAFTDADQITEPAWYGVADTVLGAAACCSLWWLRRYPRAVGIWLIVPGSISIAAGFAVLAGVYRVAVLTRPRWSVMITLGHIAFALPYHAFIPVPGMTWTMWLITIPLLYLLMLSFGLLSRSRRQVIAGLTLEAEREREGYERRLVDLRRAERERVAAEMHDVLAHRLSLLSVHAGALEYRTAHDVQAGTAPALRPEEVNAAATVIRENAHQAIEELRDVLLVLREGDPDDTLGSGRPQPRLDDLPDLVAEAIDAGQRVDLRFDRADLPPVREPVQRTAYRIVQECLTNARKYASRSLVTIEITAGDEDLRVLVHNPVPPGLTASQIPGAGTGLAGLAERARVDGGQLDVGIVAGQFMVAAELPRQAR